MSRTTSRLHVRPTRVVLVTCQDEAELEGAPTYLSLRADLRLTGLTSASSSPPMPESLPCHLLPIDSDNSPSAHATVTADGSALLACNYGGGSCVIVPLNSTGLFPVSTTDAPTESSPYLYTFPFVPTTTPLRNLGRQESSHPHQLVEVSAEDREFWVNDLGQDKVWKLRVVGEGNDLSWESVGELELTGDEGGGPRHSVVSEDSQCRISLVISSRRDPPS